MAVTLVLPGFGSQNISSKDAIIAILSVHWPLSLKQICQIVKRDYAVSVTHQAIHKMLRQLMEEGVVFKGNGGYSLSPNWINQIRLFSEQLNKTHSTTDSIVEFQHLELVNQYFDDFDQTITVTYGKLYGQKRACIVLPPQFSIPPGAAFVQLQKDFEIFHRRQYCEKDNSRYANPGLIKARDAVKGADNTINKTQNSVQPVLQEQTLMIGIIGTFTGVGAYQGQQELRGIELAVEEINSEGGIRGKPIELVVENSKADPTTALAVFEKLVKVDKLKFVIGDSWSSTTAPLVSEANKNQCILVSPLTTLDGLSAEDYFFRTMPTTVDLMEPLAEYAHKMEFQTVGILRQRTPFGAEHSYSFRKQFEKLGGSVVGEEIFGVKEADVRSQILKIGEKNPDAVLNLHATGPMQGLLVKQAKELGLETSWLSSFGAENQPLIKEYGGIIEGMVYPYAYDSDSTDSGVSRFVQSYQNRFNELPDMTAANSYDALKVVADAIRIAGEDPEKVRQQLSLVSGFEGGSGTFSFDENGDVQKTILIKKIENGKFVKIQSV